MRRLLILGACVLWPVWAAAQTTAAPQPVQQIASRADAATKTATSATSAAVLSLPPMNQGDSIYLYEIDVANCAGASAVVAAAPTTISTTNIDGGLAFTVGSGATAGLCQPFPPLIYPTGLKAQAPNLPVTITLPTFATNQTIRVNAVYRSAP